MKAVASTLGCRLRDGGTEPSVAFSTELPKLVAVGLPRGEVDSLCLWYMTSKGLLLPNKEGSCPRP